MELLFKEKLLKDKNGKQFLKTHNLISNVFYGLSMFLYVIFWIFKHPKDSSVIDVYLTCIMCPLFLFFFFMRATNYLFIYNWFYILYLSITLITFFIIALNIDIPEYKYSFLYDIGHLLITNLAGLIIAITVSLPFKMIHSQFLGCNKLYYDMDILESLDMYLYPEKYAKKEKEEFEKLKKEVGYKNNYKYDSLNETQLQAELNIAIKEDRFEDAEKIKKILEIKFR